VAESQGESRRQKFDFLSQQRVWKRSSVIPRRGDVETAGSDAVQRRSHAEGDTEPPVQQDHSLILPVTG